MFVFVYVCVRCGFQIDPTTRIKHDRRPSLDSTAEHWDLANPLQTCGFQVERRDNDLYLLFTTDNHTKLFALSKLDEENAAKSIETVMDSSRYFVTEIQNAQAKKSIRIGFGFRERDVAIDLLGNLQQFRKSIQRELLAKNMKVAEIPKLAEGEKIHVNIGGGSSKKKKLTAKKEGGGSAKPILLKKPPKASTAEERNIRLSMGGISIGDDHKSVDSDDSDVAHADTSLDRDNINTIEGDEDDFDDWDDFQSAPAAPES